MATDSEIRAWFKSRGEPVSTKGPLGNKWRLQYAAAHGDATVRLLPNPDELDDLPPLDFGTVDVDVPQERESPPAGPPATPPDGPAPEPPGPDEPPAHIREDWRGKPGKPKPGKPPRITQTIRNDISAKISFALEIPGRIWQARDPVCGGVFIEQRPEIADAFTDIVTDSAELVAFFTGPGGNFMKGLKLLAALWPVATVYMAHHVYHSIEAAPEPPGEPDYRQYAA